jgi:glycerol-3-phosphate dehydrogenase
MSAWSLAERGVALDRAERDGLDLLVVGGGISGAGVLRDAASRGLRALLVERVDFASGTSSRSSKLVHGGLRYLAEGQLAMTREACRERDLLMRLHPNLVRPIPFLFPAYRDGGIPLWKVRGALTAYAALANFRRSARFRMLGPDEVGDFCPGLRREGLVGAGLYSDGQVDDARLVLETLRSARELGAEAVNHCEVTEFFRAGGGRLSGARVRDAITGRDRHLRAHVVVNAAGPAVERIRGLDRPVATPRLRPAKGVHLVIPRSRLWAEGVVTFDAPDGRHLFLIPWDEVALLGTTDEFSEEVDEPVATIEEVHYLLGAANEFFPRAALTTNDIRCAFAGVRPLLADPEDRSPSGSVSREHCIEQDPSGLISVGGGKLTTYRSTGKAVVDRALPLLPRERARACTPSRTARLPFRDERFDADLLASELEAGFEVAPHRAQHLVRTYGLQARRLLEEAEPVERRPVGESRYTFAEIPWSFRHECAATLCDLLERRMRLAIFAIGQGLGELDEIARVAARAAGWSDERARAEALAYTHAVRTRYQIAPPATAKAARRARAHAA